MLRRVLLLLLCVIIPFQSVRAMVGELNHVQVHAQAVAKDHAQSHEHEHQHSHDHHRMAAVDVHGDDLADEASSDHPASHHCTCSAGWLTPEGWTVAHSERPTQVLPDWASQAHPAPYLEEPPRPPHSLG